jgi:hypothetical protein
MVLLPASARAATLSREGDVVVFRAAPGEANGPQFIYADVSLSGVKQIAVGDHSLPIQAGPGCNGGNLGGWIACPRDGVAELRVYTADGRDNVNVNSSPVPTVIDAGEGDDYVPPPGYGPGYLLDPVTAHGGPGNDRLEGSAFMPTNLDGGEGNDILTAGAAGALLDGGPGDDLISGGSRNDTVRGGEGADRINTRDASSDNVSCGPGVDPTVIADPKDHIASDCEDWDTVETALSIVPCTKRLVYTRRGTFRLCVAKVSEDVSGTITVKTAPSRASGKQPRTLARKRFSARGGMRTPVGFRLGKKSRRLIARRESIRLAAFANVQDARQHRAKLGALVRLYRPAPR